MALTPMYTDVLRCTRMYTDVYTDVHGSISSSGVTVLTF